MKNVTLAPYVRLCAIAGLGPWVLMKLGRESLAGNFNLVAQPRKIKQNKMAAAVNKLLFLLLYKLQRRKTMQKYKK